MPKAILRNGVIHPLEPLPSEWADGRELNVESATEADEEQDFDSWFNELQTLVAQNDVTDLARVEKAIKEADEQAKTLVRKEMGLP